MIAWMTGWKCWWPNITASSICFSELLGLRLDHHHGVVRAGDDEVEVAVGHLVEQRVQHDSPSMKPTRAAPIGPRNGTPEMVSAAEAAIIADDVGVVLHVVRQHGDDDLHLVLEAFDEQRADRPVDEAGGQRLLLGGPAFTLEEAAGDLAGGVGLLLVVHGQREEVDAGLRGLRGDDGGEHAGLAILGEDGGVGLAGHAPGLELQLAATPVNFHAMDIEHVRSFVLGFSR